MGIEFDEKITGDFIILRKIEITDAEDIFMWRTGKSGMFLRQPKGYSVQMQIDWIKNRSNDEINYIIIDILTNQKVGTIGLYDVNINDKVVNVGRLLLSDKFLNKSTPFGIEALKLVSDYVFFVLGFRKITGDILVSNAEMYKFQVFLGMKQEGYLEQHVKIRDKYEDIYIMSLFKENYEIKYRKKLLFLLKSFITNN
jgi:diamine N-acetyltransferase